MTNPFSDFLAVHESIQKRALVNRLEKALANVHHSGSVLAERSGVPLKQVLAMLSCDTKQVSLAEIEKVVKAAGGN